MDTLSARSFSKSVCRTARKRYRDGQAHRHRHRHPRFLSTRKASPVSPPLIHSHISKRSNSMQSPHTYSSSAAATLVSSSAQAMRRFGSRVTIIERNAALLHREDSDVSEGIATLFQDEGIDVILNATVAEVTGRSGESVTVSYSQDGATKTVDATHILVATGRTPNTDNMGLDLAGVELTDSGFIKVNERLETTAAGIWANGEVAGSPQFTHIALDDFRILRDNFAGGNRVTTGRQVPSTLFTDPEVAHIGLSEKEAKAKGIPYRLFKIPMAADLRTPHTFRNARLHESPHRR